MKKFELTQLTQIIEILVAKEVRKQLPAIISETFQNMKSKKTISETIYNSSDLESITEDLQVEETNFKASLKDLFAGTPVIKTNTDSPRTPKHFTKNQILNQILNETIPDLRQRDRMVGMAAFQGGYSPSVSMAAAMMPQSLNVPMEQPIGKSPMLVEGQTSNHIPMATIPDGVSALDVARQVPLQAPVAKALTRNYSQMMKLIDKKKGKI